MAKYRIQAVSTTYTYVDVEANSQSEALLIADENDELKWETLKSLWEVESVVLIKGENKATRWTDRPLTAEDKEAYGLEGENK